MPNLKPSDLEKFAFMNWKPGTPWDVSRLPFDRRLADSIVGGLLVEVLRGNVTEKAAVLLPRTTRPIALSDFVLVFAQNGKKPRSIRQHEGFAFRDWDGNALKTTVEDAVGLTRGEEHVLSGMTVEQAYRKNPGFFEKMLRQDPSMTPLPFNSSYVLRLAQDEGLVYAESGAKLKKSKPLIDMVKLAPIKSHKDAAKSRKEERKSWMQPDVFKDPDVVQKDRHMPVFTPSLGTFRAPSTPKLTSSTSVTESPSASTPFALQLVDELESAQARARRTAQELDSTRAKLANVQAKYVQAASIEAKMVVDNIMFLNKQFLEAADHTLDSIAKLDETEHNACTLQLIRIGFRIMHHVLARSPGTEQAMEDLVAFYEKLVGNDSGYGD